MAILTGISLVLFSSYHKYLHGGQCEIVKHIMYCGLFGDFYGTGY